MAQVLGKSGRYVSQQADVLRRRVFYRVSAVIMFLGIVEGLFLYQYLPVYRLPPLLFVGLAVAVLLVIWRLDRYMERHIDDLKRACRNHERGLAGESQVAQILASLPDSFHVINDLTTSYGNLDHIVVGPSGVFILDAKNWRGLITADGKREILLNGRPTDKPVISQFVRRVTTVRDQVFALAPGTKAFFEALLVFTAARVEARWGATGKANCLTDEQLHDYIVKKDFGKRLTADDVQQLAQAFLALARRDPEFIPESDASRITHHAPRITPPSSILDSQSSTPLPQPAPSRI